MTESVSLTSLILVGCTYVASLEVTPWVRAFEGLLARVRPRMRFYLVSFYSSKRCFAHTQLAAVGKRLPALRTLVRLLASVAPLVPLQGCLSRKHLPANRAFEVFVYIVSIRPRSFRGVHLQLLWVKKCPCSFDFCENGSSGR